jgi:uncharacterized protein YyaL (SSP411 family)
MRHPEGGFYSAEDADSEGEEGTFYVWTRDEVLRVLGAAEGELFCRHYGVTEEGNFEGSNILAVRGSVRGTSQGDGADPGDTESRSRKSKELLLKARTDRERPHLDDKILTDWNGLMISAFAFASRVLDEPRYADAAVGAARFVLGQVRRSDGRLMKRWRDGDADQVGLLDDYAFLTNALVDLYQATFDARWLRESVLLADEMKRLFWDGENGGFFMTPRDGEELLLRPKQIYDGAIPSGNSVAATALTRLGQMTMGEEVRGTVDELFRAFSGRIAEQPSAHPQMLVALDSYLGPTQEIAIAGPRNDGAVRAFLRGLYGRFVPRAVVMLHEGGVEGAEVVSVAPFVKGQGRLGGKAAFYVCVDHVCGAPTEDPGKALLHVNGVGPR